MRVSRSNSAVVSTTLLVCLVSLVSGISVPTGKLTPITPARPTPRALNPRAPANPAPVVEYSQDNPEPPPLDPSYVPPTFNYFDTLARHHIYYVPVRYRNFNGIASNTIDYEPPQKYFGQTLGKNVGYKPYKQQIALPYYPAPARVDWAGQYNQANNQYSSQNYNQNNQYSNQNYNQDNNQYSSQNYNQDNNQYNNPFNGQTTTQQQQYEAQAQAASTQAASASTGAPQPTAPASPARKVDYTTGKGSYDVTGKGGSKSEYYSKDDWKKKTLYPKKVLDQGLTPRKYASHKY